MFSLGLVLLEAGVLHKIQDIYGDFDCSEILEGKLRRHVLELQEKYFDNLLVISTIKKMLKLDPTRRPSFTDIRRKLPDIQEIYQHLYLQSDYIPRQNRSILVNQACLT